ncbi:branched-chain amino acid ABC transporter substrate-binding protein [Leeia sp. TBRC 13508]|uniref:Branched-chain amino acid ABC transporter substrate-binding protein n=1 Tax=Leeia speluncae TaxID=2884804 RepID=A0ABS8D3R9_9NEIS|nr:branched-chain amino acid ABC transporter substrate-binding protein [Leeia speluncae]MCB6182851.1 branched-chain amino acid ABC transporter substrate-binding protein [Leeia speluncae]
MFTKSKLVIAVASACAFAGVAHADVVVKLGQVSPMSGQIAHLGKDNEAGAILAIEDANAKKIKIGGQVVKFELVSEDDAADPKTATVVAQKLVDAGVKGVVGHLNSGTSIPASKIYNDAGIPQISPSATNPKYTLQGFKTTFRVVANDVQQGGAMGKFAIQELKAKNVAIIDDRTAYGQGLADEVEKAVKAAGGKVVAREYGTDKTTDWMAILTSVKAKKPDVVLYGGMDATAGPLLQQMKRLGINAGFVVGDGACTPAMIQLAGDGMSKNAYCTEAGVPRSMMPQGKNFEKRFKAKFGKEIQIYAPYEYDAMTAIITAMQQANSTDPKAYLPKLAAIKLSGVTGPIAFDKNGDIKGGAVTVKQFDGKEWKDVKVVR